MGSHSHPHILTPSFPTQRSSDLLLRVRGAQPRLAKGRKERPGWGHLIERELEEITGRFDPDVGGTLPRSLRLKDQGEFAIGYYHQRATKLGDDKGDQVGLDDAADNSEEGDEE